MKILIVDDHALFREGLCHVLTGLSGEFVPFMAANEGEARRHLAEHPDLNLVLLDLHIPNEDGFVILEAIRQEYPQVPVVILSATSSLRDVQRVLDAGAVGFIPKDSTSSVMRNALQVILSGGVYLPQNLLQLLKSMPPNRQGVNLTPRQRQVLELILRGRSNKAIAAELSLSEATVKMHLGYVFKILGVSNRTQAVIEAEKMGLFPR